MKKIIKGVLLLGFVVSGLALEAGLPEAPAISGCQAKAWLKEEDTGKEFLKRVTEYADPAIIVLEPAKNSIGFIIEKSKLLKESENYKKLFENFINTKLNLRAIYSSSGIKITKKAVVEEFLGPYEKSLSEDLVKKLKTI